MRIILKSFWALIIICAVMTSPSTAAVKTLWSLDLPGDAQWHKVTGLGSLLVGTKTALHHVDTESGTVMWSRDDIPRSAPFNVQEVAGTPYILVNNHEGGFNQKTSLQMVDITTGKTVWTTGEMMGANMGAYPIASHGMVLFVSGLSMHEKGAAIYLQAYGIEKGNLLWESKYADFNALKQHMADNSSNWFVKLDLSGHRRPVVEGDSVYLTFKGLHAYDLKTGEEIWGQDFKTAGDLKLTYASPIIDNATVYAAGRKYIYAFDKATGEQLWKSERLKGSRPQMALVRDKIIVRQGGQFSNGQDIVPKKPYRIVALDASSGKVIWKYKKAKKAMTSFQIDEMRQAVYFADQKRVIGLNVADGTVLFEKKLEFEHEMGTAQMAATGLSIGSGLMSGGLLGGVQGALSASSASEKNIDAPLDVSLMDQEHLIVRGQQHILCMTAEGQQPRWSYSFEAPGTNRFALIAMGAVTAMNAMANTGYHSSWSRRDTAVDNALMGANRFNTLASRRYSAAAKAKRLAYFLTNLEEGGEQGPGLISLDMTTGEVANQLYLDDKEPEYGLDELSNRVYYFKDGDKLIAYEM